MSKPFRVIVGYVLLTFLMGVVVSVKHDSLSKGYKHPDEIIAVKVSEHLINNITVDTNWQNSDLPVEFKYPQYNFSGYLLVAAAYIHALPGESELATLDSLRFFSMLLSLLVVAVVLYVATRLFGFEVGLLSAACVAVNPLLYQDGLYARPEPFLTLVFTAFIGLLSSDSVRPSWKAGLSSVLLGFMVGVKVSMLFFVPLLFLFVGKKQESGFSFDSFSAYLLYCLSRVRERIVGVIVGFSAGFLLAVPCFIFSPGVFYNGVNYLGNQYDAGDYFHGVLNGSMLDRLSHSFEYFHSIMGWMVFFLLPIGAILFFRKRQYGFLSIFIAVISFCLLFSLSPTFFERNFSHVLPALIIFSCLSLVKGVEFIANRWVSFVVFVLVAGFFLVPSIIGSLQIYHYGLSDSPAIRSQVMNSRLRQNYGIPVESLGWPTSYNMLVKAHGSPCQEYLVSISHNENVRSKEMIERLKSDAGFEEVSRIDSSLKRFQASTLQAYLSPTTVFLYKKIDEFGCKTLSKTKLTKMHLGEKFFATVTSADQWRLGGLPSGSPADPLGEPTVYASWVGSDTNVGKLDIAVDTSGHSEMVLLYKTGPVAGKLFVRVSDRENGKIVFSRKIKMSLDWKYLRIALPKSTRTVNVVAIDDGDGWGEWFALALPRKINRIDAESE